MFSNHANKLWKDILRRAICKVWQYYFSTKLNNCLLNVYQYSVVRNWISKFISINQNFFFLYGKWHNVLQCITALQLFLVNTRFEFLLHIYKRLIDSFIFELFLLTYQKKQIIRADNMTPKTSKRVNMHDDNHRMIHMRVR